MKFKKFELETFNDHRASRFFDIYPELPGQVTVSVIEPNQFSGWHRHKLQYDQFFVAQGKIKIGIISNAGEAHSEILSADKPQTVFIPPEYWHCYHSLDEQATLIYYLSRKHDESDELRATEDEIFEQYGFKI